MSVGLKIWPSALGRNMSGEGGRVTVCAHSGHSGAHRVIQCPPCTGCDVQQAQLETYTGNLATTTKIQPWLSVLNPNETMAKIWS